LCELALAESVVERKRSRRRGPRRERAQPQPIVAAD
jgi:hypothetical protein